MWLSAVSMVVFSVSSIALMWALLMDLSLRRRLATPAAAAG